MSSANDHPQTEASRATETAGSQTDNTGEPPGEHTDDGADGPSRGTGSGSSATVEAKSGTDSPKGEQHSLTVSNETEETESRPRPVSSFAEGSDQDSPAKFTETNSDNLDGDRGQGQGPGSTSGNLTGVNDLEDIATGDEVVEQVCPECGGRVDPEGTDQNCADCGLLISDTKIDRGAEWRAYNSEQKQERSRVGSPLTNTYHDKGLSTVISSQDKDANGQPLSASQQRRMHRLRKWNKRHAVKNSKERNLRSALGEIQRLCSRLELPDYIVESASKIYRRAVDEDLIRGRSIEMIATASVYIAMRQSDIPQPLSRLVQYSHEKEQYITGAYTYLCNQMDLKVEPPKLSEYLPPVSSNLDMSTRTELVARRLLDNLMEHNLHSGKDPSGVAAAAIYAGCKLTRCDSVTQADAADAAGVCALTVRERHRELLEEVGRDPEIIGTPSESEQEQKWNQIEQLPDTTDPAAHLPAIAEALELSASTRELADRLLTYLPETSIQTEVYPAGVAAAACVLASNAIPAESVSIQDAAKVVPACAFLLETASDELAAAVDECLVEELGTALADVVGSRLNQHADWFGFDDVDRQTACRLLTNLEDLKHQFACHPDILTVAALFTVSRLWPERTPPVTKREAAAIADCRWADLRAVCAMLLSATNDSPGQYLSSQSGLGADSERVASPSQAPTPAVPVSHMEPTGQSPLHLDSSVVSESGSIRSHCRSRFEAALEEAAKGEVSTRPDTHLPNPPTSDRVPSHEIHRATHELLPPLINDATDEAQKERQPPPKGGEKLKSPIEARMSSGEADATADPRPPPPDLDEQRGVDPPPFGSKWVLPPPDRLMEQGAGLPSPHNRTGAEGAVRSLGELLVTGRPPPVRDCDGLLTAPEKRGGPQAGGGLPPPTVSCPPGSPTASA